MSKHSIVCNAPCTHAISSRLEPMSTGTLLLYLPAAIRSVGAALSDTSSTVGPQPPLLAFSTVVASIASKQSRTEHFTDASSDSNCSCAVASGRAPVSYLRTGNHAASDAPVPQQVSKWQGQATSSRD